MIVFPLIFCKLYDSERQILLNYGIMNIPLYKLDDYPPPLEEVRAKGKHLCMGTWVYGYMRTRVYPFSSPLPAISK